MLKTVFKCLNKFSLCPLLNCNSIRFNSNVRVRFAPSPTGFLHVGGLRTALYNYLFAKSEGGKFIIRIEDTDQTRVVPGATEHLLSILEWAGIDPDEGPLHGGDYGPYIQSQRLTHYTKHAHDLVDSGAAYRCFCSPQRLSLLKRDQKHRQEMSRYDNKCRHLSQAEIDENLQQNKPYVIRLKVEKNVEIVEDLLFGQIKYDVSTEGDPVMLKSDRFPTYHLANVVDDHLMAITHVIRGKEWLVSTPKHVQIYKAFGWKPPEFLHPPLLINPDGSKLSKRQNDIHVEHLKEKGFSPAALINFMLYCSSGFKNVNFPLPVLDEKQLLQRLSGCFAPKSLLLSDATVDFNKLEEYSRTLTTHFLEKGSATKRDRAMRQLFDLVLKRHDHQCLFVAGKFTPDEIRSYLTCVIETRKGHIVKLNDLVTEEYDYLWCRPDVEILDHTCLAALPAIKSYLESTEWKSLVNTTVNDHIRAVSNSCHLDYPATMRFFRVIFTGREQGPKVFDIMTMLGKKEALLRLELVEQNRNNATALEVQGTNDNSIVSKLSMVNLGYQKDDYLKYFVGKPQRRCSLINRGYYIRTKIVRHVVQKFFNELPGPLQVISLGAGYDTTFFYSREINLNPENLLFVEIDYPDVICKKILLAKANGLFQDMVKTMSPCNSPVFRCKNYLAIGYDLRSVGKNLVNILKDNGVDLERFSLFLSEVVLTYLTGCQSSRVLSWIRHNFTNAMTLVFEQMLPNDSFGLVMCRHFEKLGSPLSSIHDFPSLSSQIARHKKLGFEVSCSTDLMSFYDSLPSSERRRIDDLEMFDEYEGWHRVCLHYFALSTTNSNDNRLKNLCSNAFQRGSSEPDQRNVASPPRQLSTINGTKASPLHVFGHCTSLYDGDEKVIVYGGFGVPPSFSGAVNPTSHQRLSTVVGLDLNTFDVDRAFDLNAKEVLFCTITKHEVDDDREVFIVFGGRAAPNYPSRKLRIIQRDRTQNDPGTSWKVRDVFAENGESWPSARWRHSSTISPDSAEMLVIGGRDEKSVFADCWSLELSSLKWREVRLDCKSKKHFQARHSHSVATWQHQQKLVISGGLNQASKPIDDIILLSSSGWYNRLNIVPSLPPRYSHTSHIVRDNLLLLIGGVVFPTFRDLSSSENALRDHVAVVDLDTATWCRTIEFPPSRLGHPIHIHNHASVVRRLVDDQFDLIVIGGGSNCFSFGTSFNHAPLVVTIRL